MQQKKRLELFTCRVCGQECYSENRYVNHYQMAHDTKVLITKYQDEETGETRTKVKYRMENPNGDNITELQESGGTGVSGSEKLSFTKSMTKYESMVKEKAAKIMQVDNLGELEKVPRSKESGRVTGKPTNKKEAIKEKPKTKVILVNPHSMKQQMMNSMAQHSEENLQEETVEKMESRSTRNTRRSTRRSIRENSKDQENQASEKTEHNIKALQASGGTVHGENLNLNARRSARRSIQHSKVQENQASEKTESSYDDNIKTLQVSGSTAHFDGEKSDSVVKEKAAIIQEDIPGRKRQNQNNNEVCNDPVEKISSEKQDIVIEPNNEKGQDETVNCRSEKSLSPVRESESIQQANIEQSERRKTRSQKASSSPMEEHCKEIAKTVQVDRHINNEQNSEQGKMSEGKCCPE